MPCDDFRSGSLESSSVQWEARIAAAQQGDRSAQGEIFQRLRAYLRAIAQERLDGQLKVKMSPSDVVQETLLEAHRGFANFCGNSRAELVVWVQGILNHRVQTAYRRYRGSSKRSLAREVPLQQGDSSQGILQLPVATSSTPSGHAMMEEEHERLDQAMRELPPRYEQVIRLRNELKLSFGEVATALSCSPDAAQKLWTRAVDQLSRKVRSDDKNRKR